LKTYKNQLILNRINFYEKSAPFYELTNFYESPMTIDGIQFPTSEHYFQSQKFLHLSLGEFIKSLKNPFEAVEFGLNPIFHIFTVNNWNAVRTNLLQIAVYEKAKHPNIIKVLLNTNNLPLVYLSPNDQYWGVTPTGGDNHLGKLWEEIRKNVNNNKH